MYPFRQPDDTYKAGTTLDLVMRLYAFDRQFKLLLMDAIECIEVYVRTQLAYGFAHACGPFAYRDAANFPGFTPDPDPKRDDFTRWQAKLGEQTERSKRQNLGEAFVLHFFQKYGDCPQERPIWMMIELMDFGSTLSFYRGVDSSIKQSISTAINQPEKVVQSWLLALNTVRNRCAHHARLWNWESGSRVQLPNRNKFPDWHSVVMPNRQPLPNGRMGVIIAICHYWLQHSHPASKWPERVGNLFDQHPEVDPYQMGLPQNWRTHPLWNL